jgi:hypothetical protein
MTLEVTSNQKEKQFLIKGIVLGFLFSLFLQTMIQDLAFIFK